MFCNDYLFVTCLITLFVYVVKDFVIKTYKLYKLDLPSVPGSYPIVGIIPKLLFNTQLERFNLMQNLTSSITGLSKAWVGPLCFINVNEPKLVNKVLTSDKCWSKSKLVYDQIPFGEGLFTVKSFHDWKLHRKIFSYSFTRKNLIQFMESFLECGDRMALALKPEVGKTIDTYQFALKCTSDFQLKTLTKFHDLENFEKSGMEKAFLKAYEYIDLGMALKLMFPWIYPSTIYKTTEIYKEESKGRKNLAFIFDFLIDQCKKKLEYNKLNDDVRNLEELKSMTFMDQIIYYEKELTRQQIHDHMLSFMGGFKTLGLEIAHGVLMLAMHPDVQEKVYQEIKEVYCSSDIEINYESVQQLQYMEQVIKETMRLFPTIPFILRYSTDDMEIDGHNIPKGVNFFVSIFSLHRNKDIWGENANNFDPENFSPERISKINQSAFIPFSLGKRNCIGKQYSNLAFKIFLIKLIEKYKISTHLRYDDIQLLNDMTLKFREKPWIKITERVNDF